MFVTIPENATVTVTVTGRDGELQVDGGGELILDADGKRASITVHPDVDVTQRSISGANATIEQDHEVTPLHADDSERTKAEEQLLSTTRSEAFTDVGGFGHYGIRYHRIQRDKDYCHWCGEDEPDAIAETVREEGFVIFGIPVSKRASSLSDHCSNCHISDDALRREALQEMAEPALEHE